MKNLDQIRARNALRLAETPAEELRGKEGGRVIDKIPHLIQNHGLLATCAYSYTEKSDAWKLIFDAVALHLADSEVGIIPKDQKTRQAMMTWLTGPEATSETLKLATAEAMAWLGFARRFVKKPASTNTQA